MQVNHFRREAKPLAGNVFEFFYQASTVTTRRQEWPRTKNVHTALRKCTYGNSAVSVASVRSHDSEKLFCFIWTKLGLRWRTIMELVDV